MYRFCFVLFLSVLIGVTVNAGVLEDLEKDSYTKEFGDIEGNERFNKIDKTKIGTKHRQGSKEFYSFVENAYADGELIGKAGECSKYTLRSCRLPNGRPFYDGALVKKVIRQYVDAIIKANDYALNLKLGTKIDVKKFEQAVHDGGNKIKNEVIDHIHLPLDAKYYICQEIKINSFKYF